MTACWMVKRLSMAMGKSHFRLPRFHAINPVVALLIGFAASLAAMGIQPRMGRYVAWTYWLAVVMVGVLGTMAADVLHVRFSLPYFLSSTLFAVILAAVFSAWSRTERSLSIQAVDTTRREVFHGLAVCTPFAMAPRSEI